MEGTFAVAARDRSSSPCGALVSGQQSGISTPRLLLPRGPSSASGAAEIRQEVLQRLASGSPREHALLTTMRKHTEAMEERLTARITQVKSEQDRLRQMTTTRLEEKIASTEAGYPRLDRRVAELMGCIKGVSDEMQLQIRRVDASDDRLWECRHQIEEECRGKWHEIESQLQKLTAGQRVQASAADEGSKRVNQRLQRLERDLSDAGANEGLQQAVESIQECLHSMEDRLLGLETSLPGIEAAGQHSSNYQLGILSEEMTGKFALSETKLADISNSVERIMRDSLTVQDRVEQHEERLKVLRTRWDVREESMRELQDQVELMRKRIDDLEHDKDAQQRRIQSDFTLGVPSLNLVRGGSRSNQALEVDAESAGGPAHLRWSSVVDECAGRIQDIEAQLQDLTGDVKLIQAGDPHLADLVGQLQDLGPAVIRLHGNVEEVRARQAAVERLDVFSPAVAAEKFGQLQKDVEELQAASSVKPAAEFPAAVDIGKLVVQIEDCQLTMQELRADSEAMQGKHAEDWQASLGRLAALEEKLEERHAIEASPPLDGELAAVRQDVAAVKRQLEAAPLASSEAADQWRFANLEAELKALRRLVDGVQEEVQSPRAQSSTVGITMAAVGVGALREEVAASKAQWNEVGENVAGIQQRLTALQEEVKSPRRAQQPEVGVTMATVGLAALREEVAASKLQSEQAANSIGAVSNSLNALADEVMQLQRSSAEDGASQAAEMSKVREQVESVKAECLEAAAATTKLEGAVSDLQQEVRSMQERSTPAAMSMSTVGLSALRCELQAAKATSQEAGVAVNAVQERLAALQDEVRSPRAPEIPEGSMTPSGTILTALREDLAASKQETSEARESVAQLQKRVDTLQEQMEACSSATELLRLKADIESMKQKPEAGLTVAAIGFSRLREEVQTTKQEAGNAVTAIEGKLAALEEEVRSPRSRLAPEAGLTVATIGMSALREELEKSKVHVQEANDAVAKLDANVSALRSEVQAAADARELQLQLLQEDVSVLKTHREEASLAAKHSVDEEIGALHVKVNDAVDKLGEAVESLRVGVQASATTADELQTLKNEVLVLREERKAEAEGNATTAEDLQSLKTEVLVLREEQKAEAEGSAEACRLQLQSLQEEVSVLKAQTDEATANAEALHLLREEVLALSERKTEANPAVEKLEDAVESLKAGVKASATAGELRLLKEDVLVLKERKAEVGLTFATLGLSVLRDEVEATKAEAGSEIATLKDELKLLTDSVRSLQVRESAPEAKLVQDKRGPLLSLVKSLQQDEQAESEAYSRVLDRIAEVCSKLEVVDAAVAAATPATSGEPEVAVATAPPSEDAPSAEQQQQLAALPTAELCQRLAVLICRAEATEDRASAILEQLKEAAVLTSSVAATPAARGDEVSDTA